MIKIAVSYKSMKEEYIKHESFNNILEANIALLERMLPTASPIPGSIKGFVETDIKLPGRENETLRMLFVVHPETGDIAPFWIYLLRDPQRKRLGASGAANALRAVLEELGW